jgi:hypothetical protein
VLPHATRIESEPDRGVRRVAGGPAVPGKARSPARASLLPSLTAAWPVGSCCCGDSRVRAVPVAVGFVSGKRIVWGLLRGEFGPVW